MSRVARIRQQLEEVREQTLRLCACMSEVDFRRQIHREFSPIGWHLGHIGVTEAYWILQQCKEEPTPSAAYDRFFTPTDTPKPERVHLPARDEILAYLHAVRERVLHFLTSIECDSDHPLLQDGRIFNMLLQHEEQHQETMLLILRLFAAEQYDTAKDRCHSEPKQGGGEESIYLDRGKRDSSACDLRMTDLQGDMIVVPAGPFVMGSNDIAHTLDNERPQHTVLVPAFLIDRYPVTNAEFLSFVTSGGYHEPSFWSTEGWQWREHNRVEHPLYWRKQQRGGWIELSLHHNGSLQLRHPVQSVSWYEADAYTRWLGKRLPTEEEWEKAASWNPERNEKLLYPWAGGKPDSHTCNCDAFSKETTGVDQPTAGQSSYGCTDMLGNVWEWTATWFQPYVGFTAFPYEGYSVPYFDRQHRVLRGGSWATGQHVLRTTFRNWYQPWVREIFAGFRCAKDL